jgi:hypothetical protein
MFRKGQSGNPGGRPKGAKNKLTQKIDDIIDYIAGEGSERALQIMQELPNDQFLGHYLKLIEYTRPKLRAIESDNTHDVVIRIQDETDDPRDND